MSWRARAERTIVEAYNKAKAEGKTGNDIVKAIDAAYPFGERKYHPYKQWLDVRRSFLFMYGLRDQRRELDKSIDRNEDLFANNPLFVRNQVKP